MTPIGASQQTLLLNGPFDAHAAEKLRPEFARHADNGSGDLVLDLAGVDFIDSSGIGAIVFLYKRLVGQRRLLVLTGASGQPRELLRFLRIDRTITVVDTLQPSPVTGITVGA
ncbi:MAG TPA: STAS domain-containing protein [Gammaproteobacteria bacterium]